MDCPHGIPLETMCWQCEEELEQANLEARRADPYECMAFGDAIRAEDEAAFQDIAMGEGQDWDDYSDEHPDDDHEEFPSDFGQE